MVQRFKDRFYTRYCLIRAVKVTKNADPDKYKYNGYGIRFDSRSQFSWTGGTCGKNVNLLGVDNSSSVHIHNKNKNILVLGEGPTQGLQKQQKINILLILQNQEKRFV